MAICSLIEDFGLVGFETLAVEVRRTLFCIAMAPSFARHYPKANSMYPRSFHDRLRTSQDKESMLHLTHVIDKATGCVFVPPASVGQPPDTVDASDKPSTQRPNTYSLMTSAAGPIRGPRSDVRDVQERWIDAREEWDAWEKAQWRKEGMQVQEEAARQKSKIRERKTTDSTTAKSETPAT